MACHCLSLSVEATHIGLDNEGIVNLALTLTKRGLQVNHFHLVLSTPCCGFSAVVLCAVVCL